MICEQGHSSLFVETDGNRKIVIQIHYDFSITSFLSTVESTNLSFLP